MSGTVNFVYNLINNCSPFLSITPPKATSLKYSKCQCDMPVPALSAAAVFIGSTW